MTTPSLPQAMPVPLTEPFPAGLSQPAPPSGPPLHIGVPVPVKMGIHDFNFLMVLGKGSFGKVNTPCRPAAQSHPLRFTSNQIILISAIGEL